MEFLWPSSLQQLQSFYKDFLLSRIVALIRKLGNSFVDEDVRVLFYIHAYENISIHQKRS
jgi:hypothetical protein